MRRSALMIFPAAGLLALAASHHVQAGSKAYCRDVAREIADREAGPQGITTAAASDATPGMSVMGASADGQDGVDNSLAGAGTDVSGIAPTAQWQHAFRRAYAGCRAS